MKRLLRIYSEVFVSCLTIFWVSMIKLILDEEDLFGALSVYFDVLMIAASLMLLAKLGVGRTYGPWFWVIFISVLLAMMVIDHQLLSNTAEAVSNLTEVLSAIQPDSLLLYPDDVVLDKARWRIAIALDVVAAVIIFVTAYITLKGRPQ